MKHRDEPFTDIISENVWDIRTVIDRFETIEASEDTDDTEERQAITAFLEQVAGYGGDHQWRGDWYPCGFIADGYFTDYAKELAEDIGAVKNDAEWPNSYIDWDAAAEALQGDYSSVEINGDTFWYR